MNRPSRVFIFAVGGAIGVFVLATAALVLAGLRDNLGKAEVALVLGSKVELDGTPSPRLRARLDRTLELYHASYFPSVIVSGGTGREGYDEAAVMRDYLVARGVPAEQVIMDSAGITTFASARNTIEIIRQRRIESVFVISQYFHVPRARLALRRFGVATIYSAHAHFFEFRDIYSSPRELAGYVSYLLRRYDSAAANAPDAARQIAMTFPPHAAR